MVGSADHGDWRLTARFQSISDAHKMLGVLFRNAAAEASAREARRFGVAHREGSHLRVYVSSYEDLLRARHIVADGARGEGVIGEYYAEHYREDDGEWVQTELPVLTADERALLMAVPSAGSFDAATEPDRVQVRFECVNRHDARRFAAKLEEEFPDVRCHGSYVFLYADDDASARALGERLRTHAPSAAQLFYMERGHSVFL